MSVHELIAAAYVEDLRPATKLVLMAIADSSDEHTREAAPGLPKLRAWSGLGRSQTLKVVGELCTPTPNRPPYLEHIGKGRIGRRALYRVFPAGIPVIPTPAEVADRYVLSTGGDNPVDARGSDWVLDYEEGPIPAVEGPTQTGPLHASTSVSSARRATTPPRPPVDKAATGFPGARSKDQPDPRTRPGFYDTPCPFHPGEVVPCGRCAHAAATSDPAKVAAAKAAAKAAARGATTDPQEPTDATP